MHWHCQWQQWVFSLYNICVSWLSQELFLSAGLMDRIVNYGNPHPLWGVTHQQSQPSPLPHSSCRLHLTEFMVDVTVADNSPLTTLSLTVSCVVFTFCVDSLETYCFEVFIFGVSLTTVTCTYWYVLVQGFIQPVQQLGAVRRESLAMQIAECCCRK